MTSLPIGRRIAGAFTAVLLGVFVMMGMLWWALDRIGTTSEESVHAQDIYSQALFMESSILRQNSQMRGFLITGEESYLEQYREGQATEKQAAGQLLTLLADNPAGLADVNSTTTRMADWRRVHGNPLIATARVDREAAQTIMRGKAKQITVTPVLATLRALRDAQAIRMAEVRTARNSAMRAGMWTLALGGLLLVSVTILLSVLLSRALARPIVRLTGEMDALAKGDMTITVPDASRGDEIGSMSRAVLVFRDAAIAKTRADDEQRQVVEQIGGALARLSDFDLRARLNDFPPAYAALERDFNASVAQLAGALATVREGTAGIVGNTAEMQAATDDLARRAEQQAASLEESSAAIGEMSDVVRENAVQAKSAQSVAAKAREDVKESEEIVRRTVAAIGDIERSSNEIAEIISLIDGLSFQTNLLALNAGVEAARAGDAGKGFAVVASEVRALAERSAEAARDINQRITATVGRVRNGVDLARQTDESLRGIATDINQIATIVTTIADSAAEQSSTIQQINTAIGEMDSVTQANAAMIEEINAAVGALGQETGTLEQQVNRFRVDDDRAAQRVVPIRSAARPASPAPRPAPRSAPRPVRGNTAVQAQDDDWSSF